MIRAGLIGFFFLWPTLVAAQDMLRIATWNAELSRKGLGVLIRDIISGEDAQIVAAVSHISQVAPDILVLTGMRILMVTRGGLLRRHLPRRGQCTLMCFLVSAMLGGPRGVISTRMADWGKPVMHSPMVSFTVRVV